MRLLIVFLILTTAAWAGPARTKSQAAKQLGQAYTWYDGKEKRTIWLDVTSAQARSAHARGRPIFRDHAHANGRARIPTGKLVVTFKSDWSREQVVEWAQEKGFSVQEKASWGANVYVLEAASGMEALTKSKELFESGEVLEASPDWQMEVKTR